MAKEDLIAFELDFEQLIASLPVLGLPLRTVLSGLYFVIDGLFNGHRLRASDARHVETGEAMASRLSYLVPHLLKCPREPLGVSAADAASPLFFVEQMAQIEVFISYSHFCELMPEVHRDYYSVEGNKNDGFVLRHRTPEFAQHEELDILFSDLALSYVMPPPPPSNDLFDQQAARLPKIGEEVMFPLIIKFYLHYVSHAFEAPILTDAGYEAALGASRLKFERFRAAWMAIGEYCRHMAAAVARRTRAAVTDDQRASLLEELWEWIAVMFKSAFLDGIVIALTRLERAEYERLMTIWVIDANTAHARNSGDGYYPPLLRLSDSTLFNPDVLRTMFASRNIIYASHRMEPQKFDRLISQFLEPALLDAAEAILGRLSDVVLARSIEWDTGEIDLLVYERGANAAWHIQAKAPIPPQGARMTQAIERRSLEGLKQLRAFRALPPAKRDAIISNAISLPVRDVALTDVLLCRTSFGGYGVWSQMGNVVPVNLVVLGAVVDQFVAEKASITSLAERAKHLIETIHRDVSQGWEHADVFLGGVRFNIPLLRLDQRRFGMIRHALFPEATRSVAGDKIEEILPRIHLIIKMLEDLSTDKDLPNDEPG